MNAHALANTLDSAILLIDERGRLEFANSTAAELVGATNATDERLQMVWVRIREELEASGECGLDELPPNLRLDVTSPIGGKKRLRAVVRRLTADVNPGYVVILRDLHLVDMLEHDIRLASRYRNLRRIQRVAAHDMKGALNAVTLNAQVLKQLLKRLTTSDTETLQQSQKYAASIIDSVARLANLRQDILGREVDTSEDVGELDLQACIKACADRVAFMCTERAITIRVETTSEPMVVTGNRELMDQALMNLALNAIDAMPRGGELTIGSSIVDGRAQVRVSDHGPGIPAAILDKIWELNLTTRELGAGIGQHVAWLVVKDHGGNIREWNRPEGGTTFEISLPLIQRSL